MAKLSIGAHSSCVELRGAILLTKIANPPFINGLQPLVVPRALLSIRITTSVAMKGFMPTVWEYVSHGLQIFL